MLYYYSVFDKKTSGFGTPMPFPHVQKALRAVQNLLASKEAGDYGTYPGDFCLMHLGTFDQTTGRFMQTVEGGPTFVIEIAQLMPVQPSGKEADNG